MLTKAFFAAALAAIGVSAFGFDPPAYDATYTEQGVTYAQRGGLGMKDFVVTNIVVNGQPRPLPPYLYLLELDDTYPDDAEWYYQNADYAGGGHCSVRRDGNLVERNYDWHFDDAATFVLKVSGEEGRRFASVSVANVGTNLTDKFVRSGAWSRFYKCLAGHSVDGVNENGVFAEVNVTSGSWGRTSGTVHGLGAVRWVLDHGTNAQQAAEYIAANVYLPQGFGVNFHYLIADRSKTYIVENGEAHEVTDAPAVMTNFNLDRQGGEGYERYASLTNGATIQSQWWTKAYSPLTRPIRFSDLGANYESIWERWADKPREAHRGEASGGQTWWQTVHCSVYDLQKLTLRIAVQEVEDWYVFACPSVGKVKSVNGRTGEVVLDAEDVGSLPIGGGTMTGSIVLGDNTHLKSYLGTNIIWYANGEIWGWNDGGDTEHTPLFKLTYPKRDGELAVTSDIPPPYVPATNELCWVNNAVTTRDGEKTITAADLGAFPTSNSGRTFFWNGTTIMTDAESIISPLLIAGNIGNSTTYGNGNVSIITGISSPIYTQSFQFRSGTIALTSDIPAPYTPDPKELCWKNNAVMTRDNTKTIGAGDIGALPNDEESLVSNSNFSNAVVRVSPPVELPQKWALANVTNAQGQAVGAADVHALPDTTQVPDVSTVNTGYAANADNAESAGFAENANYAVSAGTAGEANTALSAGEAGRADYANEAGIANAAYLAMDAGVQRNWNALVPMYETDPQFNLWKTNNAVVLGERASAGASAIAIGMGAKVTANHSIAIGVQNKATANGAVVLGGGGGASVSGYGAAQIGTGANTTPLTLQFRGTTVVDGNGQIPVSSLDTPVRSIYDNNVYTQPNAELAAWNWSTNAFDGIQPRYMGDGTWQVQSLPSGWTATLPVVISAGIDTTYLPLVLKHGADEVLVYAHRDLATPVPSGKTWAVEDAHSLAMAFLSATGETGGDSECIATNICKLIEPHIEAVNTVEQFWDAELEANWVVVIDNEDMKYSVSTNTDQTAFIRADPVLEDDTTKLPYRIVVEGSEMKFFTK